MAKCKECAGSGDTVVIRDMEQILKPCKVCHGTGTEPQAKVELTEAQVEIICMDMYSISWLLQNNVML